MDTEAAVAAELTRALAADLDAAFERLVLAQQDRLYSIALRMLGDGRDAEEVAQDAFVRAYRALATYDDERILDLQLRPWLTTIVLNLCRNRTRRRLPTTQPLDADDDRALPAGALVSTDRHGSPHDSALRRESARDWAALVAALPMHYRAAVVLRHVDGLSYSEMSTALGRPEGTLKAQVHRGLAMLRAGLAPTNNTERSAEHTAERQEMTA
jgi:RNA polymerase sigma-70 factor (ECF subfamily)